MTFNKYRNKPTSIEGMRFASRKEAKRYQELCILQSIGEISKLQTQVTFPLVVNNELICKYRADFVYDEKGKRIVEDSKGFKTPEYKIKAKLMKACLGIEVMET